MAIPTEQTDQLGRGSPEQLPVTFVRRSAGETPPRWRCCLHEKRQRRSSVRARRRGAVFLIGDVPAPCDGAAGLVILLHRDVDHEPARGRAVPMVLRWLKEHAVARTDDLDRTALALA